MTASSVARRLHPWRRLAVRMGLGLCLGAAAILWLADQLEPRAPARAARGAGRALRRPRSPTWRAARRTTRCSATTPRAFAASSRTSARRRASTASAIYNKEGRVRVSSVPAEEGTLVDKRSDECIACHAGAQPKAGLERSDRIRMLRAPDGERVLGIITPIYNEPACTACHVHPASQRVLGVLDVRLSMTQADAMVRASERQMHVRPRRHRPRGRGAVVPAAVGARAAAGQAAALRHGHGRRGRPRARACPCAAATRSASLARSWNDMTGELQRAREELEGLNRTLEERVRGEDARARAHAPPDAGGREDGLARQAGGRRGPRDQQPARGHPHLRPPAAAAARRRDRRAPDARAGGRDRPHPGDGRQRGRALRRHRAQPARLQPPVRRAPRRGGPGAGRRALPAAAQPPGGAAGRDARGARRRRTCRRSCATRRRSSR